jgi:hypothetical protein
MNRRDLIKGVLALPLVCSPGMLAFDSKQHQSIAPIKLLIILEGPFVIVLHPQPKSRIQVFLPMDLPFKRHVFFLNDNQYRDKQADQLHNIKFTGDDALDLKDFPNISDPCLTDFKYSATGDPGRGDDLIQIDLPSPDRIYCPPGYNTPVKFENGKPGTARSGHVLEYTLKNGSSPSFMMADDIMGNQKPKFLGVWVFALQVGLRLRAGEKDPDKGGGHAIHFHNESLLKRFSAIELDSDKRLSYVGDIQDKINKRDQGPGFVATASAVECKMGGFIATP